jgi:hypothetical protein
MALIYFLQQVRFLSYFPVNRNGTIGTMIPSYAGAGSDNN